MATPPAAHDALDAALAHDPRVLIAGFDIDGVPRGKSILTRKLVASVPGGFGFCSVVFGWDMHDAPYTTATRVATEETGFGDVVAKIDVDSMRRSPWDEAEGRRVPFFLVDFYHPITREPLAVCPRGLLKRVVADLNALGLDPLCAMEFEFFNFLETPQSMADKGHERATPLTPGMFGYSLVRPALHKRYFDALAHATADFGIPIEGLHTETGPGVYEAAIEYTRAVEAADRAQLFKYAARRVGIEHGVVPSFMAKPHNDLPGCSGHLHISLVDLESRSNAAYDADTAKEEATGAGLSPTFQHFIAGLLDGLPSMLAIFAPTINSYKRLVEGYWAPTVVSWGRENRTAAIRVLAPPTCAPYATRLELRVPGADVNAHLAMAAALACGLRGIREAMPLPAPVTGSAYADARLPRLARRLEEAVDVMDARGSVARQVLGDAFVDHYVATRRHECGLYARAVTDWERRRYLETV